jgi:hypothetical protein
MVMLKKLRAKAAPDAVGRQRLLGHGLPDVVSGEEDLATDVERLHDREPGWDEPMRVAGAQRRLQAGMPRDRVIAIYGKATVALAVRQMERLEHRAAG